MDDLTAIYGKPLIVFGRLAWAHDFVANPSLSAAFEMLPGGSFTVNGAPVPHDSALTTARYATVSDAAMDFAGQIRWRVRQRFPNLRWHRYAALCVVAHSA